MSKDSSDTFLHLNFSYLYWFGLLWTEQEQVRDRHGNPVWKAEMLGWERQNRKDLLSKRAYSTVSRIQWNTITSISWKMINSEWTKSKHIVYITDGINRLHIHNSSFVQYQIINHGILIQCITWYCLSQKWAQSGVQYQGPAHISWWLNHAYKSCYHTAYFFNIL